MIFISLSIEKITVPCSYCAPLSHLTTYTSTTSNLYLANSLAAALSEPALYRLIQCIGGWANGTLSKVKSSFVRKKPYILEILNRPRYTCRIWTNIHPPGTAPKNEHKLLNVILDK